MQAAQDSRSLRALSYRRHRTDPVASHETATLSSASCEEARGMQDGAPQSVGEWQRLVAEIAELEELIDDLGGQNDALALLDRQRLAELLRCKRGLLRAALNRGRPGVRAPG